MHVHGVEATRRQAHRPRTRETHCSGTAKGDEVAGSSRPQLRERFIYRRLELTSQRPYRRRLLPKNIALCLRAAPQRLLEGC